MDANYTAAQRAQTMGRVVFSNEPGFTAAEIAQMCPSTWKSPEKRKRIAEMYIVPNDAPDDGPPPDTGTKE